MKRIKTIIQGAAGRDFHNFNTVYRDNELYDVVAFTAAQIPGIDDRKYPAVLAGKLYPKGIPIYPQDELINLIGKHKVDEVVYAYSDVPHIYVMHWASQILAAGADFKIISGRETMIKSTKPVVAVCAVRTGAGKSQTSRAVAEILKAAGKRVVAVRHPMPYGDLAKQTVQRFGSIADLKKHKCTIEEMEEYEPHIARGQVIYSGVDYEKILREAEKEADVILWDGGNNDLPFYKPDVFITVADPHRAGDELTYHPGETNLRLADAVVINKIDTASFEQTQILRKSIDEVNPKAMIIEAASPISAKNPEVIRGKRVLVIEDGPTCTHGDMKYGAGVILAKKYGAAEVVDPRPYTVGSITETFKTYPNIGPLLPAMGYGDKQIRELEATITKSKVEVVIIATPIDLGRVIKLDKPFVRVEYGSQIIGSPDLKDALAPILKAKTKK